MDKVFVGTVIWFSNKKGFGFIEWYIDGVKQNDMFVHFSDISTQGYKSLEKSQKISFKIGQNRNGDPKAIEVTI